MGNEVFARHCERMPAYMQRMMEGDPFPMKARPEWKGLHAVYAFYLDGTACHVGRTRNLQGRISGHLSRSHYSASFAFAETRRSLGISATYRKGEGRAVLFARPEFQAEFQRHLKRIADMTLRFVDVSDPIDQHLFELYAALELNTSLDEFSTS